MGSAGPNFWGQEIAGEKLNCGGCNYPRGEIATAQEMDASPLQGELRWFSPAFRPLSP